MSVKEEVIQLDFTGDEALEYAEFVEQKKQKFMAQYPEIFNKIKEYDAQISRLLAAAAKKSNFMLTSATNTFPGFDLSGNNYPPNGTWNQKIRYFLKMYGKLTARQIKDNVAAQENVAPANTKERKRIGIGIAASLSTGASGDIIKYKRTKNEDGDYVYELA